MKKLLLLIFALSVAVFFYLLHKRQSEINNIKEAQKSYQQNNQNTQESSITTNTSTTRTTETTIITNKTVSTKLNSKKPEDIFSSSSTGKQIIRLLELYRYIDEPTSDKGKEAWDNIQKLVSNPDDTFKEIKNGVSSLAPEYETKRQYLIQLASSLNVEKKKKLKFLSNELSNSLTNAKDPQNIQMALTPAIIFETYIKTAGDNKEAERVLTEALPNSTPEVQKTLLSSFNKINPKKTSELMKKYNIK